MEAASCVSCGLAEHRGPEFVGAYLVDYANGGEVDATGAAVASGAVFEGVLGADGAVGVLGEVEHRSLALLNKSYPTTLRRATYPSRLPFSPETLMWLCIDDL